jgi:hypothetical protein
MFFVLYVKLENNLRNAIAWQEQQEYQERYSSAESA